MSGERLSPARPDGGSKASYGPRLRWGWIGGIVLLVGLLVAGWQFQTSRRVASQRAALMQGHRPFEAAGARYQTFRERVEEMVRRSITRTTEPFANERLNLTELHSKDGLYLRLPNTVGKDLDSLETAVRSMTGDALPRCLGVTPMSLRGFYESADFFGERFTRRVEEASEDLVFEALANEIRRRGVQHAAGLRTAESSDYLLIVIERGVTPRAGPVDVYVWDLTQQRDDLVLFARTAPRGVLVPARALFPGLPAPTAPPLDATEIADDCSVAAQVKAVAGIELQEFESAEQLAQPDA